VIVLDCDLPGVHRRRPLQPGEAAFGLAPPHPGIWTAVRSESSPACLRIGRRCSASSSSSRPRPRTPQISPDLRCTGNRHRPRIQERSTDAALGRCGQPLAPKVDHRIWVLSARLLEQHRPGVTHDIYQIRSKGRLGVTALSAFPSMAHQVKGGETELTGVLEDSSALFRVVAEIEALVSSCSSSARSRRDQNHRDAVMTSHPTLGECSSGDWTPTTCGPSRQPGEALPGGGICPSLLTLVTFC